ncbi:hypothetical protein J3A83DRAFT_4196531 [Scleroderma citrinum]
MGSAKKKIPLLEIIWSENNHAQVWNLIAEISKPINYKTYKCHAVKPHTTGSGVRADANADGSDSDEFCDFYIGADGPNEAHLKRPRIFGVCDWITKEFPFFPELHRIFVAHPNVTSIAVGVGVPGVAEESRKLSQHVQTRVPTPMW